TMSPFLNVAFESVNEYSLAETLTATLADDAAGRAAAYEATASAVTSAATTARMRRDRCTLRLLELDECRRGRLAWYSPAKRFTRYQHFLQTGRAAAAAAAEPRPPPRRRVTAARTCRRRRC